MARTKVVVDVITVSGTLGAAIIVKDEKNEIRQYLLGKLGEAGEEQLELRLLTEPSFSEEFDVVVDEITDQYIANEFQGEERERVEQYFLRAPERQIKLKFACELLQQASSERGGEVVDVTGQLVGQPHPGLFERASLFWRKPSLAFLVALTAAAVVIASVLFILLRPGSPSRASYTPVELAISTPNRGQGSAPTRVKLQPGTPGIVISLTIPDQIRPAENYRAKLLGQEAEADLPLVERDNNQLMFAVPAALLKPGSYAIQIYAVNADGTEQRIPGSYFFDVE